MRLVARTFRSGQAESSSATIGAAVEHLLEVVQHQQESPVAQVILQGLDQGLLATPITPRAPAIAGATRARVRDRGERHEENAVCELLQDLGGDLQPEAGLAGPRGPGEGQESRAGVQQPLPHRAHLLLPSYQCGGLHGQVVRARVQGAQGREVLRHTGRRKLEDPLRAGEVLEAMLTQVPEAHAGGQLVANQLLGGQ